MKILLGVFLFVLATSAHADTRDSIDQVFYKIQIDHLQKHQCGSWGSGEPYKIWKKKAMIKGSWRWDMEEWMRFDLLPEYYYDDELKASNSGWCLG